MTIFFVQHFFSVFLEIVSTRGARSVPDTRTMRKFEKIIRTLQRWRRHWWEQIEDGLTEVNGRRRWKIYSLHYWIFRVYSLLIASSCIHCFILVIFNPPNLSQLLYAVLLCCLTLSRFIFIRHASRKRERSWMQMTASKYTKNTQLGTLLLSRVRELVKATFSFIFESSCCVDLCSVASFITELHEIFIFFTFAVLPLTGNFSLAPQRRRWRIAA